MRRLIVCGGESCKTHADEALIRSNQEGVIKNSTWYCKRCSQSHGIESDGSTLSIPLSEE